MVVGLLEEEMVVGLLEEEIVVELLEEEMVVDVEYIFGQQYLVNKALPGSPSNHTT
jgi:hypothetical protein